MIWQIHFKALRNLKADTKSDLLQIFRKVILKTLTFLIYNKTVEEIKKKKKIRNHIFLQQTKIIKV